MVRVSGSRRCCSKASRSRYDGNGPDARPGMVRQSRERRRWLHCTAVPDPYLAFEYAEPGDTIHIARGTYYGRFEGGSWVVPAPDLTILVSGSSGTRRRCWEASWTS